MRKKVCVVIPIYKEKPDRYDRLSLNLIQKNLPCYDRFFITYYGMDMDQYKRYKGIKTVYFPKRYFQSISTYSRLLLKEKFYRRFIEYRYMLIVQTDALVLGNAQMLESFTRRGFDYWGARWEDPVEICSFEIQKDFKRKLLRTLPNCGNYLFKNPKMCCVGNGGLSLRNIRKTIALLQEKKLYAWLWLDNEDKFFAYHGQTNRAGYRIAPIELVDKFSIESMVRSIDEIRPFGVHGWDRLGKSVVLRYIDDIGVGMNARLGGKTHA